ncbi:TonB-dependent receptor plug domain-containing protein, partial [Novosphingobium sp.]|uniref:TonB-dependent receptor plug domain-containing protein n=1 Tax=Novosphingobium sp. TaxID=1874826 RepID=UPI0025D4056F
MATSKSFGSPRFGRFAALSTTSGLVLAAALMAQPALAQTVPAAEDTADADKPTPVETAEESTSNEIVVTGYRASLQNAQGVKRRADTVVDVISAEDIGALPDRSVAEALQRVPGVNIGRFEKPSDPDRFSVEGTGVIIRGLPYVRSELNGRDIFSANGGIVLSFNDVSPELLGRVEVFKNATSDMIEGSIAGTVNLVTRKPLDRSGTHLAGSVEMNYGDLRKKWSPTFNVLGSTTVETGAGRLGFQLGYSNSELKSRTDASQIGDPCYRAPSLNGDCIRAVFVNSGGFGNAPNFDASNFPPAGSVLVPEYAGVRTTTLDRKRNAWNATLQYEDPTGDFVVTAEWLRSETTFATEEYALIGRRDDPTTPVIEARDSWQYDNSGKFVSGILTQGAGNAYASPFGLGGVPVDSLRFLRDTKSVTSDYSFDVKWNVSDRLRLKFEAQRVESDLRRDS